MNGAIYKEEDKSTTEPTRDCISMGGSLHSEQAIHFVTYYHKYNSNACNNSELQMQEWKWLRGQVSEKQSIQCKPGLSQDKNSRVHSLLSSDQM
eukprot:scaffold14183_cov67-Attheya_sp.AAC.3